MTNKPTGGPAYPVKDLIQRNENGGLYGREVSSIGLTVRDAFAISFIGGYMANTDMVFPTREDAAREAY